MDYKTKLINGVGEALGIGEKNEVSDSIISDLKELQEELPNFKIKVPLMGGFNAGKSSLLNTYLGNDRLPTDIKPETAIAGELKYASEEKVIAHHQNSSEERYNIDQISEITGDYLYLEIFQNNSKLNKLEDIILVDMPGLDSSLEVHNRAIMNYIDEGVFYIVVADIDHGLKGTIISFLRELNLYQLNFAVLLNKSDRKPTSQVKDIVDNTTNIVHKLANNGVFVGNTSAKEGEIDDFIDIINSLDKENLTKIKFKDQVLNIIDSLLSQLEVRISFQSADTSEIDNRINEIEKKIVEVERKIEQEKSKIDNQFSNQTPEQILNDVRSALQSNMSRLVQAAQAGESNFSSTVNQVIRPVLNSSSQKNINVVLKESFDNISSDLEELLKIIEQVPVKIPGGPTEGPMKNFKFDNKTNAIFKSIIAGLGITTTVVAPWLNVIIFFLPEVFKLLGFGGNKEEKIKNQIQSKAIPDIINQLRPKVQSSLTQTNEKFIEQVNEEVRKEKEQLVDALNKAKEERKMAKEEFANQKEEFEKDIKRLEEIKRSLA